MKHEYLKIWIPWDFLTKLKHGFEVCLSVAPHNFVSLLMQQKGHYFTAREESRG